MSIAISKVLILLHIAAIPTGDQRTVDDDITNILRLLIFPTLMESSAIQTSNSEGLGLQYYFY